MDSQHNPLVIALLFVSPTIWRAWKQGRNPRPQARQTIQITTAAAGSTANWGIPASDQGELISTKTDVLDLAVNTRGGDAGQVLLSTYPKELNSTQPFQLLETLLQSIYQVQNGLTGRDGLSSSANNPRPPYSIEEDAYVLAESRNELQVPITYTDVADNTFIKASVLKRGDYAVNVDYNVQNADEKPLEVSTFGQLEQSITLPSHPDTGSSNFVLHTFHGATYSMPDEKYREYKLNTIVDSENLSISSKGGQAAMLRQCFVMAWIPHNDSTDNFYTANLDSGVAAIGYKSQPVLVQPDRADVMNSTLWIGSEIQDRVAIIAPHPDLTIDYGWLWFTSQPLLRLLKWIHNFVGNWGFSTITIASTVRDIVYPPTKAQYTSMVEVCMLQPKIQAIRKRLDGDKQHIGQEAMMLYKTEKVNPLDGRFPLLTQMPIFLMLYYILMGSAELRQALLTLWIYGLLTQNPHCILPILMSVVTFFIQKMSPTTVTNPMQQKIVISMPVIFTMFFPWFLPGPVLCYIVSNLVTIIQQQLTYRGLKGRGLHNRKRKKS